jgi:hypothetical protein
LGFAKKQQHSTKITSPGEDAFCTPHLEQLTPSVCGFHAHFSPRRAECISLLSLSRHSFAAELHHAVEQTCRRATPRFSVSNRLIFVVCTEMPLTLCGEKREWIRIYIMLVSRGRAVGLYVCGAGDDESMCAKGG